MRKHFLLLTLILAANTCFTQSDYQDTIHLETGYRGIIEIGHQLGFGSYAYDRFRLDYINAAQIAPQFSMGIGTGLRYYLYEKKLLIPIYADFRVHLNRKPISPYISMGIGSSFNATDGFENSGLLVMPTFGLSFVCKNKSAINIGLCLEMQRYKVHRVSLHGYKPYTTYYRVPALGVNIGYSF